VAKNSQHSFMHLEARAHQIGSIFGKQSIGYGVCFEWHTSTFIYTQSRENYLYHRIVTSNRV